MSDLLFRNEVIEASRNRLTGTVIAAVPPSSRLYTSLIGTAAFLMLLLLLFGSYTNTADVRGVVAYDGGVARVYPRSAAEVTAIHVRNGQTVEAGEPLVTLAIAAGQGGVTPQLTQIGNQDAELDRQLELGQLQASSELAALEQQHAGLESVIATLERQKGLAAGQIRLAESALRRAERLAAEQAGTQRQVEDSRSQLLARRAELEALNEQLLTQRNSLRNNEAERARRKIEGEQRQSILTAQRAALAQQQAELSRTGQLVLTAPVSGTVGDISVEVGQQVTPEKSAVSIIPSGSNLEVWLYAPSRAVGNARPGQKVRLQFDAFPFQKFGAGVGEVREVARVPTEPSNVDPGLKMEEPVFRIRTHIVSAAPTPKVAMSSLRPGMTVSGKLLLERRNLWQIVLGPVMDGFR